MSTCLTTVRPRWPGVHDCSLNISRVQLDSSWRVTEWQNGSGRPLLNITPSLGRFSIDEIKFID